MKTIFVSVAGAAVLLASPAPAADFYPEAPPPVVRPLRTICDEFGRCWREPRRGGVVIDDSYDAMPPGRYIGPRPYDARRGAGAAIYEPDVDVDVDIDR